jgi:predicted amino acid dehydrogenase
MSLRHEGSERPLPVAKHLCLVTSEQDNLENNQRELLGTINTLARTHSRTIPPEAIRLTRDRINSAFDEYKNPTKTADSAFLLHTRRSADSHPALDDSGRCLPAFALEYGVSEDVVEQAWRLTPPFEVGRIAGLMPNGEAVECTTISVPITPQALKEASLGSATGAARYARPLVEQATDLAMRMGATTIGLGETLAATTHHGKVLEKRFPNADIVTGHQATTYFMGEWTKEAARALGVDLSKIPVAVVGANGSIGKAMTDFLLEQGVGELYLHDRDNPEIMNALLKRAKDIVKEYPLLKGKIHVSGGDDNLGAALKPTRLGLVAAAFERPTIKADHLSRGTILVNDSMPPGITNEEARRAGSETIWVVGKMPLGMYDTAAGFGLIDNAQWTCGIEVILKAALGSGSFESVGPVTPERVKAIGKILTDLNMNELPTPQAWGEAIDLDFARRA